MKANLKWNLCTWRKAVDELVRAEMSAWRQYHEERNYGVKIMKKICKEERKACLLGSLLAWKSAEAAQARRPKGEPAMLWWERWTRAENKSTVKMWKAAIKEMSEMKRNKWSLYQNEIFWMKRVGCANQQQTAWLAKKLSVYNEKAEKLKCKWQIHVMQLSNEEYRK